MASQVVRNGARNGHEVRRNGVWTLVAAGSTVLFVLAVWGAVADAVAGDWLTMIGLPIVGVVWFWIAGGAWRRTTWSG